METAEELRRNRWLPPSPHREGILRVIDEGRAWIEERGHSIPPLLVFEDGGVVELHKVRFAETPRGMQLVGTDDPVEPGRTKHPDVCGTVEEMQRLFENRTELKESDLVLASRLLDDASYMIERMSRRARSYRRFSEEVSGLCERIMALDVPAEDRAREKASELRALLRGLREGRGFPKEDCAELAEEMRHVAGRTEGCLSKCKAAAMEIGALFEAIKGGRAWKLERKGDGTEPVDPGNREGIPRTAGSQGPARPARRCSKGGQRCQ